MIKFIKWKLLIIPVAGIALWGIYVVTLHSRDTAGINPKSSPIPTATVSQVILNDVPTAMPEPTLTAQKSPLVDQQCDTARQKEQAEVISGMENRIRTNINYAQTSIGLLQVQLKAVNISSSDRTYRESLIQQNNLVISDGQKNILENQKELKSIGNCLLLNDLAINISRTFNGDNLPEIPANPIVVVVSTPKPCDLVGQASALNSEDIVYQQFITDEQARDRRVLSSINASFSSISPNVYQSAQGDESGAERSLFQSNLATGKNVHDQRILTIKGRCY